MVALCVRAIVRDGRREFTGKYVRGFWISDKNKDEHSLTHSKTHTHTCARAHAHTHTQIGRHGASCELSTCPHRDRQDRQASHATIGDGGDGRRGAGAGPAWREGTGHFFTLVPETRLNFAREAQGTFLASQTPRVRFIHELMKTTNIFQNKEPKPVFIHVKNRRFSPEGSETKTMH